MSRLRAEVLGDEYLAMKRNAEAANAYRRTLAMMPGRHVSQLGLDKSR
jgi:predicted negative regulator of RcsB-dependent stress response